MFDSLDGETVMETMKQLGLSDDAAPTIYDASTSMESSEDAAKRFDKEAQQSKRKTVLFRKPKVEQDRPPQQSELTSIHLRELATRANRVHDDRVLWLTTIESPYQRGGALYTLVQDNMGQVMTLSLWNYLELSHEANIALKLVLPQGSYLAILAPLVVPQEEQHGGGALLIRCDNPQCVKHFDNLEMWKGAQGQPTTNTKAKTSSAAKLKDQGNQAFAKNAYRAAFRLYSQALEVASKNKEVEVTVSCLGNLSEACLQMNRYEEPSIGLAKSWMSTIQRTSRQDFDWLEHCCTKINRQQPKTWPCDSANMVQAIHPFRTC
jgi:hypothetical protein